MQANASGNMSGRKMGLLAVVGLAASLAVLPGCELGGEATVTSPYTGRPVTAAALVAEAAAQERGVVAEAEDEYARLRAQAEDEIAAERRRGEQARADFDAAMRLLDLETQTRVVELQRLHEQTTSEAADAIERLSTRLEQARVQSEARLVRSRETIQSRLDATLADLRAQSERRDQLLGMIDSVTQSPALTAALAVVPGASIIGNVIQLATGWAQARRRREAESLARAEAAARQQAEARAAQQAAEAERRIREVADKTWDDAIAAERESQRRVDDAWDASEERATSRGLVAALAGRTAESKTGV